MYFYNALYRASHCAYPMSTAIFAYVQLDNWFEIWLQMIELLLNAMFSFW